MKIQYLGHSSFLLEAGGTRLVADPFGAIGLPFPNVAADAVTVSHGHYDHANVRAVRAPLVLSRAGEYSVGAFSVSAIPAFHDEVRGKKRGENLIFRFRAAGAEVCHLGDLGEPISDDLLRRIGKPDALLVPVGGNYTIDGEEAAALVKAVRPAFAVPMHFYVKGLGVDVSDASEFLARFPQAKRSAALEIPEGGLSGADRTEIVILERVKP